eukprot:CAMPEP_0195533556 /NCGR_PEP_ID=MMETSP0794_2-20130614/40723_1 /TAXON_ID=515487 /ORGANISM="Stephanopyxis turris, Strain CCMP 815" /LENGTH=118 /DNA_ID=CAMNT_0040666125 /DNA_START=18 /DNA_END=371 /DNA_ORIENTATION=+
MMKHSFVVLMVYSAIFSCIPLVTSKTQQEDESSSASSSHDVIRYGRQHYNTIQYIRSTILHESLYRSLRERHVLYSASTDNNKHGHRDVMQQEGQVTLSKPSPVLKPLPSPAASAAAA